MILAQNHNQQVTPLHRRGAGGEVSNPIRIRPKRIKTSVSALALLLLTLIAPACAPNESPPPSKTPQNLVLLTDTSQWKSNSLATYKDSLTNEGYRVIVSGYPGETPQALTARLPWLLQPGVHLFLYDEKLAGAAGYDSLVNYLKRNGLETSVKAIDSAR